MGHIALIALHLAALLWAPIGLLATIPLHLIYSAVRRNSRKPDPSAPHPNTHRRCPDCRELVRADANRCVHCGTRLAPQSAPTKAERSTADTHGFVLAVRDQRVPAQDT